MRGQTQSGVTKYHSLQDCFFERLPEAHVEEANFDTILGRSDIPQEDVPTLSDEQVSLLARDLQSQIDNEADTL